MISTSILRDGQNHNDTDEPNAQDSKSLMFVTLSLLGFRDNNCMSPSSLSSCDGIDDDECNFFSDSDELPSKSTDEKPDIGSGFSTPSTVQPVAAGQEEPERTPVPAPLDADRLHSLFSEYEKLVNGQEVPREREGSPDESTNLSMPKYLAQLTTDL